MALLLDKVTFTHDNAIDPLFDNIGIHFPPGWTGIIGANGTGKTTLLGLACGTLEPQSGRVQGPDFTIYCPQRTDEAPELLEALIESTDADACTIKGRLGLGDDWPDRWDTLSHGERKRAQIAVALWQQPDVLAIDEPTNHIDAQARDLLAQALRSFRGVGLLVSHDRQLLDTLCSQCLIIDPPSVSMRPGGYTDAFALAQQDEERMRDEYERIKRETEQIAQEAARRRREASSSDRKRSKKGLARGDSDAREKLDMMRWSGGDGKAGKLATQLDGRLQQAQERLSQFNLKRRYDLHFWLPGFRSHRNMLFSLPEGSIDLGDGRRLHYPELIMAPDDRIAITGPNGTGKSTLIRRIVESIQILGDKLIYLPQEISAEQSSQVMAEVNSLARDQLGTVMTVVSCLGSRPERLVGNTSVSPGELRKVLLALGISRAPHLIIMDEPTNHLDLPAIECLEQALEGCPCGLLLVSHDFHFLSRLTRVRWDLSPDSTSNADIKLTISAMEDH